jgi:hypothetical protein
MGALPHLDRREALRALLAGAAGIAAFSGSRAGYA